MAGIETLGLLDRPRDAARLEPGGEVAPTVLTFGLRPAGASTAAAVLRARSDMGYETHLTWRDVKRVGRLVPPSFPVWVCAGAALVQAAIDAGARATIICGGNANATLAALLEQIVADGARVRYRGRFDWPGVAMANRIIGRCGIAPWRMGASDYESGLVRARETNLDVMPLDGGAIDSTWDACLTEVMTREGVALGDRALMPDLLDDLLS